jgi:hypothetical protein
LVRTRLGFDSQQRLQWGCGRNGSAAVLHAAGRGSSPRFSTKSWRVGQAVKAPPSQGGKRGFESHTRRHMCPSPSGSGRHASNVKVGGSNPSGCATCGCRLTAMAPAFQAGMLLVRIQSAAPHTSGVGVTRGTERLPWERQERRTHAAAPGQITRPSPTGWGSRLLSGREQVRVLQDAPQKRIGSPPVLPSSRSGGSRNEH